MSAALRAIGRQLDDPAALAHALDDLLATRTEPPALLGLGEPTHGIAAFPLLRNEILSHLVESGYRSIALEIDFFAATVVDDYTAGVTAEIDTVLATGFSHGFGAIPGNRELVEWLRTFNTGRAQSDRVRLYGFDAPVEYSGAPSPRYFLSSVAAFLPPALRPASARDIDALVGEEADWTNQAAMFDPAVSIGDSDRARALRVVADDLAGAMRRAGPGLRPADPTGYEHALAHARTALGLLRYHAAMASVAPDRIAAILSVRAEMMADNVLAIVEQERRRGPTLVFAHNSHLLSVSDEASWANAGALVAQTLGDRYLFVATDASPDPDPETWQGMLAQATDRRALFPAPALRAALPSSMKAAEPIVPGHIPFTPTDLAGADAIIFVADTDGTRHRYW